MIVLDASALIDVIIDQPAANWVLEQIKNEEITAPAHQMAEVLSALARLVRVGELDPAGAKDALEEALALPQRLVPLGADHLRRAYALREQIHVLDGLYVALADAVGCALITTDRRLGRADVPCEIRFPAS